MLRATKAKIDYWESRGILVSVKQKNFVTWISSLNPVEKAHGKEEDEVLTKDHIRLICNCKNVNKAIIREPCIT